MLNNIKITDIRKTKRGYNALFTDEGFLVSVDDMVLQQNNLQIGSCLTQQELNCVIGQGQNARAVDKCYNLLSFRMHGKRELYNKLLKNFDAETAQYAVDKMDDLGLINDTTFAQMKAEYLLNIKKYSLSATRAKLISLGIDKEVINGVLLSFDIDNQIDEIVNIINKKYASKLGQPEKIVAALIRKGFKYGEIRQAMSKIDIDIDVQEY